jgi:hypothetical protein
MKLLHAAATAAFLACTTPASAQVLDLSTVKCSDFLASGKDAIAMIVMWLDGYYSDDDASAVIDFGKVGTKVTRIGEACTKEPSKLLSDVAEDILGK